MNDSLYPAVSRVLHSLILFGDLSPGRDWSRHDIGKRIQRDLAFQIESGGPKKVTDRTLDRATDQVIAHGLLLRLPGHSPSVPDCSADALKDMFETRDILDMTTAAHFEAGRNKCWEKASYLPLQEVMKLAALCYFLTGKDPDSDVAPTESFLKKLEIVLTHADSIVEIALQSRASDSMKRLPREEADFIRNKFVAPPPGFPNELREVAHCFSNSFKSHLLPHGPSQLQIVQGFEKQIKLQSKMVQGFKKAIHESLATDVVDRFFQFVDIKSGSLTDALCLDVKKRARLLFQIKDADFHESLARDAGLHTMVPLLRMTHTLPDVPWTKKFLEKPASEFFDIMVPVVWEHQCILDSIDEVHEARELKVSKRPNVKLAVRNHMRRTLDRFYTVRDEFPGYSFSPQDIVTYPFQAADDDFDRFAISHAVVQAKDNGQPCSAATAEKVGKEDRSRNRTAKKKKR